MKWVIALVLAVCITAPANADAGDPGTMPVMRLNVTTVCVLPDFAETGSKWRVHAAVRNWNEAQSDILFTTSRVDGCAVVTVRRYEKIDGHCGYTSFDNWGPVELIDQVYWYSGAAVYLNDYCVPALSQRFSKYVVAHELGHAIGLPHSFSKRSIMSYTYNVYSLRGRVGAIDALAVHNLYHSP